MAVIILAAAIRWFVNFALVVAIILLSAPKTPAQDALGSFSNGLVEVAALSLGGVTALVVSHDAWYLALILPLLLVLHRTLLLRQYEVAARTDTKTGLANATHWSHWPAANCPGRNATTPRSASSCSTWTTSSRSTTPTGTSPATRC